MGNLCAFLAFLGILFMSNSHSAVACILVPSDFVAYNQFLVCISNLHVLSIHIQCVVVLLSTIASVASTVFIRVCILV